MIQDIFDIKTLRNRVDEARKQKRNTHRLGGHASHIGIKPNELRASAGENSSQAFKNYFVKPLFGFDSSVNQKATFYAYYNVDTPEHLREILKSPKKYCPGGVYIMRIHGTFVNFLDLSCDIQEDIIRRLAS